ncbi:glycosyltransferase family 2 protein [Sphingobacterium sp. SGR-19]|uniref:glycosyltransferase family 2 protein n=1 Tax=Sphingobacterium sp. SGR-19 TaxID=2710886 RepID=UPI0013EAE67E|nr:glycosyltransferase family 2 protein [Sphingobacterium sp. SGR-19]NGM64060.1 glycosyltransferase family 2 protein [Sphingobacterium sp. SGR-19]
MNVPVVSIIIPVYNAADTLHSCLTSLEKQSYTHLELLFVNDCSTDHSLEMLEDFALSSKDRETITVKIISHETNQGVAAARNTGLEHATGDYIYYVDADDWIEDNTIQLAVEEAEQSGADIVGFDWYLSFAKKERLMQQPRFLTPKDAITGMLEGKMRWNLWLFLVKRSLYEKNNIRFIPQRNMGEDMMVTFKLFALATKVSHLPQALYHYGQSNADSLTKVYSDKHIAEVTENMEEIERFFSTGKYAEVIRTKLDLLKLNIKLPLLISGRSARYQKWCSWFPGSNRYAWDNNAQSLRIRLIQWAAWKKQFWMVKLHYYGIIRLVYGVIYR